MNDPFLREAIDGFDSVEGNHLSAIRKLEEQIGGKKEKKPSKPGPWIWIVVLIAALLAASPFLWKTIRQTIESTTQTMTLLVSMIAVISLIVGGIGVMNIMLVSVTERTQEIGVRMAVGARQSDIMQQFLIEAVMVCFIGGILGIALALSIGALFDRVSSNFSMIFSATSIIAAFTCSTLIGVLFGFLPAKNAAKLDPVVALSRE